MSAPEPKGSYPHHHLGDGGRPDGCGMGWRRGKFSLVLVALQIVFIILFAVLVEYSPGANAKPSKNSHNTDADYPGNSELNHYYSMFQDVHVMIFAGFGFLMTFLKRYGFGSVGLNLLLGAFVIQWATLMGGFLHLHDGKIEVSIQTLLTSDFACAAVLISFGAVLGKLSPLQLIIMSLFEIAVFSVNEKIGLSVFEAVDIGGSMFVHVFGAYFGISCARVLYRKDVEKSGKEGSVYHSDVFAMIGTIFLWMFWPSFNSALAPGDDQHRAVMNTYFALAACTVVTFAISALVNKEDKLDMVHIQNATLAAGVAVGTSADMMIQLWGALLIGAAAAIISVLGYRYLTPIMASKLKLHDTCGVNNLHGMPGILAAIAGAIATAMATKENYGASMYEIFPARAPELNTTEYFALQDEYPGVEFTPGLGRSAGKQAGYQLVAAAVTLIMAIVGGAVTGLILRLPLWDQPRGESIFEDEDWWELPEHHHGDETSDLKNGSGYEPTEMNKYTVSDAKC